MPMNRSTRTLLAAVFLIAALFIAMNYAVEATPLLGWWLPLVLFMIGVALVASSRFTTRSDEVVANTATPATLHEYTFAQPGAAPGLSAGTGAGQEQAGEVNVREPLDEEQSRKGDVMTEAPAVEAAITSPSSAPAEEISSVPVVSKPLAARPQTPQEAARMAGTDVPVTNVEPPAEQAAYAAADASGQGVPTHPVQPQTPEVSSAERLQADGVVLQPADTAENEFHTGEHVEHTLPTEAPTKTNQTTGEGAGHAPIAPEERAVLDTQAAPDQSQGAVQANAPDVVDAVVNDVNRETAAAGLPQSEAVASPPAGGPAVDNLTIIHGIGPKIASALNAVGIDSFTKLSSASDADLENAIHAAGVRLAPTLNTWREQAAFLARGDRAGFESLRRKLTQGGVDSGD